MERYFKEKKIKDFVKFRRYSNIFLYKFVAESCEKGTEACKYLYSTAVGRQAGCPQFKLSKETIRKNHDVSVFIEETFNTFINKIIEEYHFENALVVCNKTLSFS